jgi:hypothetical protein
MSTFAVNLAYPVGRAIFTLAKKSAPDVIVSGPGWT